MPTISSGSGGGSSRTRGGLAAVAAPPTMRPPPTADRDRPYAEEAAPIVPAGPCHHHHGCPQCHAEATAARQQLLNQSRKRPLPSTRPLQPQPQPQPQAKATSAASEATAGIRRRKAPGPAASSSQQVQRAYQQQLGALGSSHGSSSSGSSLPYPQQQLQQQQQQHHHHHHPHAGPILRSAFPAIGQQRRRRRRKAGGAGLLSLLLAWAKRPFVATAAVLTGQRGVLPLDSPFKRGWDVLTVCLSVIFLCIDAAALLRAHGGDHHPAGSSTSGDGSGGSNGGRGMKGAGRGSPGADSAAGPAGPAAALGAMGLRDLLLLEVLWFAVDMALQFRTETEVTVIEEDPTTGEERERIVLLQEPQAIALHYLQRDFWLDLLFAFPWRGLSALLLPRRKRPNRFRRLVGGAAKKVGGAVGGAKRAIGDRIPRFMRWGFIKGFVTWTHVLEVKRVDGAKHLVRNRKSYRLLRYIVKGTRSLLSLHVFTFVRRVGNKVAAHWAVGFEEEDWEEEGVDGVAARWEPHHHYEYHQQQLLVHEQMVPPPFAHVHAAGGEEVLEGEEEEEATAAGSTGSDCGDEEGGGMEEEQGDQADDEGPWPSSSFTISSPPLPGAVRGGVERRTL